MKLTVLLISDEKSEESYQKDIDYQSASLKNSLINPIDKEFQGIYGEVPFVFLQQAVDYTHENGQKLIISNFSSFSSDILSLTYLKDKGVDFEFFDFKSANIENLDTIIATLQYLSDIKGRKIKRGLEARKAQGFQLGNPNNFTDEVRLKAIASRTDNALADIHNQKATEKIVELKEQGFSYGKIANRLNELGYRTRYGKHFFAISVSRLYKRAVQLKQGHHIADDVESSERYQRLLYLDRKIELQEAGDAKKGNVAVTEVISAPSFELNMPITLNFLQSLSEPAKLYVENEADKKTGVKRVFDIASHDTKLVIDSIDQVGLYYWRLIMDGEAIQFGRFTVDK